MRAKASSEGGVPTFREAKGKYEQTETIEIKKAIVCNKRLLSIYLITEAKEDGN